MSDEYERLIHKYPGRIPIIITKYNDSTLPDLDKHKFIVPKNITTSQLIYILRKRIHLESTQAIFIHINNILPPSNTPIYELYNEYKSDNGFLYINYTNENTFG